MIINAIFAWFQTGREDKFLIFYWYSFSPMCWKKLAHLTLYFTFYDAKLFWNAHQSRWFYYLSQKTKNYSIIFVVYRYSKICNQTRFAIPSLRIFARWIIIIMTSVWYAAYSQPAASLHCHILNTPIQRPLDPTIATSTNRKTRKPRNSSLLTCW